MKTLTITTILIVAGTFTTIAQDYKVKKGTILKDKVPIGTVEGKIGAFRQADIQFKNLNEEVYLIVKQGKFSTGYPYQATLMWYSLEFPKFQRTILLKQENLFPSEKSFIKNALAGQGIHLDNDGIKEEDLEKFKDYSSELVKDSLHQKKLVGEIKSALSNELISRDRSKPLKFSTKDSAGESYISQGKSDNGSSIVIGKFSSDAKKIVIYRRLPQKVEYNGKMTDYIPAGLIYFSTISTLFLYHEGKDVSHLVISFDKEQVDKSATEAINYMVEKNLL